jgi:hypothetical protein
MTGHQPIPHGIAEGKVEIKRSGLMDLATLGKKKMFRNALDQILYTKACAFRIIEMSRRWQGIECNGHLRFW